MTYHFGFIPSPTLNNMIREAQTLIQQQANVDYYPYRNDITHRIAQELIDNLMTDLIAVITNPERQARLQKVADIVQSTTDTLINHIVGKDDNQTVLLSFDFLQQRSLLIDPEGQQRIGFLLNDSQKDILLTGLNKQLLINLDKNDHLPKSELAKIQKSLETLTACTMQHFMLDFTKTLKLGLIKRKAIPMAETAILKAINMAINKLLPQLPIEALERLINHFQSFIVKTSE